MRYLRWPGRMMLVAVAAALVVLPAATPAAAAIPKSLKDACKPGDAADGETEDDVRLRFFLCDDGTPSVGGLSANAGGVKAITVPQTYGGDGFSGLPPKTDAQPNTGADENGEIALDVDISWPDPERHPPPRGGYPLVVMMHGCCAGSRTGWEAKSVDDTREKWHYSNAWFAARGYAVITYTARGFVDANNRGSTGENQLDSRRYEINDYQSLAGQLVDTSFEVAGRKVTVDPERVVATGGSYGGGFSWLALTDPTWRSPKGTAMRLVAAAPKYGWTDLIYSLIPNGSHPRDAATTTDPAEADDLLGTAKRSITAALYLSGTTGVPPPGAHTTFPSVIDDSFLCLQSPLPFNGNPQCTPLLDTLVPETYNDRSAYYQNQFFERIATDPAARVPVFSAGTFTDPLFTAVEHRRMVERLKATVPGYPVQEYYGDYNHFVQNKAKEWGDLCGKDMHVCAYDDYPGGNLNATPGNLQRAGATTRLTSFIDHYARPQGNPHEPLPSFDVTAGLQICPANAGGDFPADQPGERFTESTFGELAPDVLRLEVTGDRTTVNEVNPNSHAIRSDPVQNTISNSSRCPVSTDPAAPGVAVYDFEPLAEDVVMIGRTRVTVPHTGSGSDIVLAARLYEVLPDGSAVMVDRGPRTIPDPNGTTTFDLHGNGWRFTKGNRIRIELTQDDDPFLKASTVPSTLTLSGVTLELPVRTVGPDALVRAPRLASDVATGPRFPFSATSRSGELAGVSRVEVTAADTLGGSPRAVSTAAGAASFKGRLGRTYRLSARLFDRGGVAGEAATGTTVVPLDERRLTRRRGWKRIRSAKAWQRTLSRGKPGARLRFRFRGDRVFIVGRKSRRGGRALVILNGKRKRVSFFSRRTRNRAVVFAGRARAGRANRLRVVVLRGRGKRRRVEIDAVGARRL